MVCSNYFWNCSFFAFTKLDWNCVPRNMMREPFFLGLFSKSSDTQNLGVWVLSYLHQLRWEIHTDPSTKMAGHLQKKPWIFEGSCQRVPSPHDFWNFVAELVQNAPAFFLLDPAGWVQHAAYRWRYLAPHDARFFDTQRDSGKEKQTIHHMSFTIYNNNSFGNIKS